jgi:Holliday junction resolvasome RuvABC endonuclease subunit
MSGLIVLGIDPGSNKMGVSVVHNDKIVLADCFESDKDMCPDLRSKIRWMAISLEDYFGKIISVCSRMPDVVCIEEGTYRGVAENSFKRLLGVIEYVIPPYIEIMTINPSSLKKYYGSGKLDKAEVASSLRDGLLPSQGRAILDKAVKNKQWDITDSLAVSFYGYRKKQEELNLREGWPKE